MGPQSKPCSAETEALEWQDWRQRFIQARSTQLILMLAVVFGVGLSAHCQHSFDCC